MQNNYARALRVLSLAKQSHIWALVTLAAGMLSGLGSAFKSAKSLFKNQWKNKLFEFGKGVALPAIPVRV